MVEGTARLERANNWVAASRVFHLRQAPRWSRERDLNLHGLPHYHLKVACMPISPRPHMYRWVIKDSNLSLFIQLSEETHPPYTGSDTHSGCFRSFYSHSSLYYLSAPCGSTHMYSRLVICLAGLRHPIRLVAQDIAFMVGEVGLEPTYPEGGRFTASCHCH